MVYSVSINIDILGQLMPNILTIAAQLVATAILFGVAYKLLWAPVQKIIEERSEYEQSRLTSADGLKKENEALNAEAKAEIEKVRSEAQATIAKAQAEGSRIKESLIEEGRTKASQLIEEAQTSIALQKKKMMEDMHEEIVEIAISAAEKMLQRKLDSDADKESIEMFIKEVSGE